MNEHIDYQVLAPDSVAWYIQAALVADRTGNVAARDMALAEAQRVVEERRLVPAPDGSRVLCYDCRTTDQRLDALEERIDALESWRQHCEEFDALLAQVRGANRHDGGRWITCPFCVDDPLGMCSACNGTRRIYEMEMPREDGA